MNKFTCTILAAALSLSAYSASAATTKSSTDESATVNTSDASQLTQQNDMTKSMPSKKRMSNKNCMPKNNMKMMDTNHDGKVSKEEFLAHSEKMFDMMKQTDGMVDLKDMTTGMHGKSNKGSMNNKPMGTTNDGSGIDAVDSPINDSNTEPK